MFTAKIKPSMKKFLLFTFLLIAGSLSLKAQVKVGYMNPNAVLAQLPQVAAIDAEIEQLVNQRDAELMQKSTQLQQDFTAYEEQRPQLTPDQQAAKEEELLQRNQELEQDRQGYLNEINQRRAALMQPVIEKMDVAIQEVAKSRNLDLVLNEGTSYGDAIIFYAAEDGFNITDEVLAKLSAQ